MVKELPVVVNGWSLYAHPCFVSQYEKLESQVLALKAKFPQDYKKKNTTKRLAAIQRLIFDIIPQNPNKPEYRQGRALGNEHKHWFRAKFFQQYRLFFRFHASSKTIVYAWVNDEFSKRAYGSKSDAYQVFEKMLKFGHPPDDWETLVAGLGVP